MTIVPLNHPPPQPSASPATNGQNVTLTATNAPQERVSDWIEAVAKNHVGISALIGTLGTEFTKARNARVNVNKTFAWLVFAFMAGTVGVCAWLVYAGRMSDGALTFLLGIMVAYMLRFIDNLNLGGEEG